MPKNRIRQAANTLFCSGGLRGVSIDDICRSIGIAKKTFYLFYANKDDLVQEFIEGSFLKIHQTLQENLVPPEAIQKLKIFDGHLADFLRIFYPVLIADLRRYHDAPYQIFIHNRKKLVGYLVAIIELGKQQGAFRENLDSLILAELRFDELERIFSRRNEVGLGDLYRSQRELFEHYLAGLVLSQGVVT
jgi:AcrR family transcriptional regulator